MTGSTTYLSSQVLSSAYKRFFQYVRTDLWLLVVAGAIVLGITITNTVMIWLLGVPFDMLQKGQFDELGHTLLLLAGVILLNQSCHFGAIFFLGWLGLRFSGRLRNALLNHLLSLSYAATGRFSKGDILARLSNDVGKVQELFIDAPLFIISHFLTLIFYISMLFWLDARLALFALFFTPLFLLHQRFFSPYKRQISQNFYSKNGELLSFEEDTLSNLRGVSSFGAEALMGRMHQNIFTGFMYWGVRDKRLSAAFDASFAILIYFTGITIVFIGISDIREGTITVGQLVSFLLYLGYLSVPVRGLTHLPFQCQGDAVAAQRLIEVFDNRAEVTEAHDAQPLSVIHGEIVCSNLRFSYPQGKPVFNGFSLVIHPGETIALVGPSGAGKSTLAKLLMRFYDPQEGTITIDGQSLREVTLASLRSNVAVVWQEPFLINDTIRANLLIARSDATEDAMIEACRSAQIWESIIELEKGLGTVIGTGGVDISAGQRQRLSIAQAFLRAAPILILDEASSALDSNTEQRLVSAIEHLRQGRTTLIIAHRYSSLRSADRVVYFNGDGGITVGHHDELVKTHEGYQRAVQWQSGVVPEFVTPTTENKHAT